MHSDRRQQIARRAEAAGPWFIVAVAMLAAAVLAGVRVDGSQQKPAAAIPAMIRLPPGWQLNRMPAGPFRTEVALSPDGSFLVFSATPDGTMAKAMLYRRPLDRDESTVIPGTEAACMPSVSPDGQWIAFWANGKLLKVAANGGAPAAICDLPRRPIGMCWGSDGTIIFGMSGSGLGYVSAVGGTPATLTTTDALTPTHRLPHLLPGGKSLVFTAMPFPGGVQARIEGLSLDTGKRKVLIEDAADARYVASGHLIFLRKGTLMAVPFNPDRLETAGPAVTVRTGLMQDLNYSGPWPDMNSSSGQFTVSESGTLVFAAGGIFPDLLADLYWVDRSGRAERWKEFGTRSVMATRLSPDGQQVGFTTSGLHRSAAIYNIKRGTVSTLASDGQPIGPPVWTRDGRRVAFAWSKTGPTAIWWTAGDGNGKTEQLTRPVSEVLERASSWSPDGKYLAVVEGRSTGTGLDILLLRMGDRQMVPFAATKSFEVFPEFSPDGHWLAYASTESGQVEIYVRSFPDGKRTMPISTGGGTAPLWSRNGRELFYWNTAFTKLMKVDISAGQNLSAGTPKELFEFAATASAMVRNYDITPDGQRFLIRGKKEIALPPVTQLNVVRNLFDELKRLSPSGK